MEQLLNQRTNASDEGNRLDKYVTGLLSGISRTVIQEAVRNGLIRVNGARVKPSHVLSAGDLV